MPCPCAAHPRVAIKDKHVEGHVQERTHPVNFDLIVRVEADGILGQDKPDELVGRRRG